MLTVNTSPGLTHITLTVYRQLKMLQLGPSWNARKLTTSHPFLENFIGCPFRNVHPTQTSFYHKQVIHGNTPLYLSDFLHIYTPSHPLRSASRSLLGVPRPRDSKTKRYVQRAFRHVSPPLWNALPGGTKERDSIQSFRVSLKTLLQLLSPSSDCDSGCGDSTNLLCCW